MVVHKNSLAVFSDGGEQVVHDLAAFLRGHFVQQEKRAHAVVLLCQGGSQIRLVNACLWQVCELALCMLHLDCGHINNIQKPLGAESLRELPGKITIDTGSLQDALARSKFGTGGFNQTAGIPPQNG